MSRFTGAASALIPQAWFDGKVRLVGLPSFDDVRGSLVPFAFEQLPFVPRRSFVVGEVPVGTVRGRHALLEQQQLLVCVAGRIEVEIRLGGARRRVVLDRADWGLFVDAGVWSSQRFAAEGSILLGFASAAFDPDGYMDDTFEDD